MALPPVAEWLQYHPPVHKAAVASIDGSQQSIVHSFQELHSSNRSITNNFEQRVQKKIQADGGKLGPISCMLIDHASCVEVGLLV